MGIRKFYNMLITSVAEVDFHVNKDGFIRTKCGEACPLVYLANNLPEEKRGYRKWDNTKPHIAARIINIEQEVANNIICASDHNLLDLKRVAKYHNWPHNRLKATIRIRQRLFEVLNLPNKKL